MGVISTFLGGGFVGGVVVALLNFLHSSRENRIVRRVEQVSTQVRSLYGPLYFFIAYNKNLLDLTHALHKIGHDEYANKNWSTDIATQKSVTEEIQQTIDMGNQYLEVVIANNEKMMHIIIDNYAAVDPDDIDFLQQFVTDCTRRKTEHDNMGKSRLPLRVVMAADKIAFYRQDFHDRIKAKFDAKTAELRRYQMRSF